MKFYFWACIILALISIALDRVGFSLILALFALLIAVLEEMKDEIVTASKNEAAQCQQCKTVNNDLTKENQNG